MPFRSDYKSHDCAPEKTGKPYIGRVAAWRPPDSSGEALFYVMYSDGDSEDCLEEEIIRSTKRIVVCVCVLCVWLHELVPCFRNLFDI